MKARMDAFTPPECSLKAKRILIFRRDSSGKLRIFNPLKRRQSPLLPRRRPQSPRHSQKPIQGPRKHSRRQSPLLKQ